MSSNTPDLIVRDVRFGARYLRPTEVDDLIGHPTKTTQQLGWTATAHTPAVATLMLDADTRCL